MKSKFTPPSFPLKVESVIHSHSMQDENRSLSQLGSTPAFSKNSDSSSITPPEAWGGERLSDKFTYHRHSVNLPSRFAMMGSSSLMSGSMFSGSQDLTSSSQTSTSYLANSSLSLANLRRDISSNQETSLGFLEHVPSSSTSISLGTKSTTGQSNLDVLGSTLTLPLPAKKAYHIL